MQLLHNPISRFRLIVMNLFIISMDESDRLPTSLFLKAKLYPGFFANCYDCVSPLLFQYFRSNLLSKVRIKWLLTSRPWTSFTYSSLLTKSYVWSTSHEEVNTIYLSIMLYCWCKSLLVCEHCLLDVGLYNVCSNL